MQNSKIEWTDHTFNPWWGCVKVSPGCQHCYAETLNHRYGFSNWGPAKTTSRRMMSENYWKQPLRWNKEAGAAGERRRVFCASMADVFEDHPQVMEPRARLFSLIEQTPALDWLLLTKRPENINLMAPWHGEPGMYHGWPANVWLGTSVENQEQADIRIPELLKVPAAVRFLSCEPLLGAVDITTNGYLSAGWAGATLPGIDWIIAGGESGPGARPMHPAWVRSLRDQCIAAGVPFFFKQWGEWAPYDGRVDTLAVIKTNGEWARTYTCDVFNDEVLMERLGKHTAGRLLDGRAWNELPV